MILAIVGSRAYTDIGAVVRYVDALPADTVVVSGGARGVDWTAAYEAKKCGLAVVEILPDYETHGRIAPLVRNEEIALRCDRMVAFWDGLSRGTAHAVACAKRLGKPVEVVQ